MGRPADPNARAALVAAARAEFLKHGVLKARVEDITGACGLSKGAFYLHFPTKEALLWDLVDQLKAAFATLRLAHEHSRQQMKPRGKGRPLPSLLELGEQLDQELLETLWQWRDVIDVLLQGSRGTEFEGLLWTVLDEQFELVQVEFNELQRLGVMRADVSGEALGLLVIGAYLMVARRLVQSKSKPDLSALVRAVGLVVSQGVAPAGPGARASRAGRVVPGKPRARASKRSLQ